MGAIRLATTAVDGGRVFDLELDRELRRLVWELDVASSAKAYDVRLNARSARPARRVVELARTRGARLVVLGSRGRRFGRSVSRDVVRRADRPVLVAGTTAPVAA